jgi:hypothetical protein
MLVLVYHMVSVSKHPYEYIGNQGLNLVAIFFDPDNDIESLRPDDFV